MAHVKGDSAQFARAPFTGADDLDRLHESVDVLELPIRPGDRYITGFASSRRCIEAAQRLRFEVFNLELEEGLASSVSTGLDRDDYDEQMTHLVLIDRESGRVVGTYRMQSMERARSARGIYAAEEYELAALEPFLDGAIELGRACLAADHRNFRAMIAMWLGIGGFMNAYGLRYVFGCCSLTTQDPDDGWRAMKTLREAKCLHPDILVQAKAKNSCGPSNREFAEDLGPALKLPKLFRAYLRLGCQVVSGPAIDHDFGTIDFLILLDGYKVALSRLDILG
jgi:putative hemolysin